MGHSAVTIIWRIPHSASPIHPTSDDQLRARGVRYVQRYGVSLRVHGDEGYAQARDFDRGKPRRRSGSSPLLTSDYGLDQKAD